MSHTKRPDSLRLKGYDYCLPGAYFITVCTVGRRHLLGEVVAGIFHKNELGALVQTVWEQQPAAFNRLLPDVCVVMPNHFHAILAISDNPAAGPSARSTSVPAVVQAFKSIATVSARRLGLLQESGLFQSGYHDHVVRNDAALERIRNYIFNNPAQWELDAENHTRTGLNPFYAWLAEEGKATPK